MIADLSAGLLGGAIRIARMEQAISQENLAELVGITPTHLKHIESEHRKPSVEVLYKIVVALKLSLDAIFLPSTQQENPDYQRAALLLGQCSDKQAKIILATLEAMLRSDS